MSNRFEDGVFADRVSVADTEPDMRLAIAVHSARVPVQERIKQLMRCVSFWKNPKHWKNKKKGKANLKRYEKQLEELLKPKSAKGGESNTNGLSRWQKTSRESRALSRSRTKKPGDRFFPIP